MTPRNSKPSDQTRTQPPSALPSWPLRVCPSCSKRLWLPINANLHHGLPESPNQHQHASLHHDNSPGLHIPCRNARQTPQPRASAKQNKKKSLSPGRPFLPRQRQQIAEPTEHLSAQRKKNLLHSTYAASPVNPLPLSTIACSQQ